ncbi:hypothetical protein HJC02_21375 [Rhizobium sp. NLR4a]|uniref:hypothetical protein n=1 Tax=Rhizobium sp. NLR4a TaxID=2731117 RepID=UPI001C835B35|nr:hypothetical protein [Rhizobium sp. NLR4a]MBX5234789.1 hypothetical protein [Rhizobium sp. NLR4a]
MNWNNWCRQVHRWLSIAFTLIVIVNIIAMVQEKSAVWVGLLALLPFGLFVLPYAAKRRVGCIGG